VSNATRGVTLAARSGRATNPVSRGVGLIGRRGLPEGGGLIIQPCNSVVSFFMRFPIDVLFLDGEGLILHIIETMIPWRASRFVRGSKLVIELPAGTAERTGTQVGDAIDITPN
jgi:uncharacterized membrane protein (UPF0127 family)